MKRRESKIWRHGHLVQDLGGREKIKDSLGYILNFRIAWVTVGKDIRERKRER